jgi:hypothetical protein
VPSAASRLWQRYEPYHAVVYFAPEARDLFREAGWTGFWMGYFATRAAPLGPIGPAPVTALFFGFAPRVVERALPEAWRRCPPERAWGVRLQLADRSLRRLLGDDGVAGAGIEEAAELALEAAAAAPIAGRALAAATAAMPVPDEPHLALWLATTVLREHRGDGHVASLVAAGVGPCEAHVLSAESGRAPEEALRKHRGWTAEEWAAAVEQASQRPPGTRAELEAATDAAAAAPWQALGTARTERLADLLDPLVTHITAAGEMPFPNLIGVPEHS